MSQQVETSRFGQVEVEDERCLTLIAPIIGFEDHEKFALLDHSEDSPFKWLQSFSDPELAFVVTMPALFGLDYEFELPDEATTALELKTAENVLVFTLVTIPEENPALMTTNLLGPIVMNTENQKAMQVVLNDSEKYGTKVRLITDEELEEAAEQQPQAEEASLAQTEA